ncbi:TraK family protein [Duganella sp. BuS-21]|uniref:TraK family protein n=1 Tax=Duganella sp. BuS-21 TaxID=2943848 RepID=UPI0035A59D8D
MGKNYPDQLGDWISRRATTTRDRNLVAFLAVRDDVCAALAAGYNVKTIWSNLHESKRITVSYSAFRRYVKKFATQAPVAVPASPSSSPAPSAPRPSSKPDKPSGFVFNPTPNKEELL